MHCDHVSQFQKNSRVQNLDFIPEIYYEKIDDDEDSDVGIDCSQDTLSCVGSDYSIEVEDHYDQVDSNVFDPYIATVWSMTNILKLSLSMAARAAVPVL